MAPAAPSAARTHKIFTYTHKQTHTGAHAATQPLGDKSAALLHPVRLNRGSVPAANLPSCVVSLVNFSTVQRSESCLPHRARMKSCPPEPVSGLHHLFPPSSRSPSTPLFLLPLAPSRLPAELGHSSSPCVALTFYALLMEPLYLCHTLSLHRPPPPTLPPPPPLIDLFFPSLPHSGSLPYSLHPLVNVLELLL